MKKLILVLVLSCSIFLTGCNKDTQINAFMKEFEKATSEIGEKFDEGNINGARKVLEDEKPDLRAKWLAISTIWSFQVSDSVKKKMDSEPKRSMEKLVKSANQAINKHPSETKKIQDIINDLTILLN